VERYADLPVEDISQLDVVPALDRSRSRVIVVVEPIGADGPALVVDPHLHGADGRLEDLLHALQIGVRVRARTPFRGI
jgi:hypothetical protein